MKRLTLLVTLLFTISSSFAQQNQVRQGNKLYEQKKYKEAAGVYQDALKKNPNYLPGIFNLGNALYQNKNYDASRKVYDASARKAGDPAVKASSSYNIGNTYMSEQKWKEAVDAYKQALRSNPQDADAKYNLSYALSKMKQNQGGGGKDKNKDKNKDQQDKDQQNKDKQDQNKDQQNKDQDNKQEQKEQQEQKPQPQPSKLNEKQAEQLLNALAQEEKKLHDKKEKGKAVKVKVEKDW